MELIKDDVTAKNFGEALKDLSRAFEASSKAVQPCQLEKVGELFAQLSDELGFHHISEEIEGVISVIVNGENIYDDLFNMAKALAGNDWNAAGSELGSALKAIMKWHSGNSCDDPTCLVLEGFTKALGLIGSDFQDCEADIKASWDHILEAIGDFKNHQSFADAANGERRGLSWNLRADGVAVENSSSIDTYYEKRGRNLRVQWKWWDKVKEDFKKIVHTVEDDVKTDWSKLVDKIEAVEGDEHVVKGLVALATALDDLAHSVSACHAPEIAKIAVELAAKLGFPVVGWLETVFAVVFNGAQVYDDIFNAVVDYENKNYIGLGYEVAKLAIVVVEDVA